VFSETLFGRIMPDNLPEFKKYNVIYGWNGSGKTLLSRIFAGLRRGEPPACESIVVTLSSGDQIRSDAFANAPAILNIRVFNRDFVEEAVYKAGSPVQPIYVFGEKAKQKQKELNDVTKLIKEVDEELRSNEKARSEKERRLNQICSDGARAVRESLGIPGRRYERDDFRKDIEALLSEGDPNQFLQDPEEEKRLRQQIRLEPRSKLNPISFSFASSASLLERAKDLCGVSVSAAIIDELKQQPDVNRWVEDGFNLHKKHHAEICLFCNQPIPAERLRKLEGHFSQDYKKLTGEVDQLKGNINHVKQEVNNLRLPDPSSLYPDLKDRYAEAQESFNTTCNHFVQKLDALLGILDNKRGDPFSDHASRIPSLHLDDETIDAVNSVIDEHNGKVANHQADVEKAMKELKYHLIAGRAKEYRDLNDRQKRRPASRIVGKILRGTWLSIVDPLKSLTVNSQAISDITSFSLKLRKPVIGS